MGWKPKGNGLQVVLILLLLWFLFNELIPSPEWDAEIPD